MAVELATGYVSLVPSGRGFGAALNKEVGSDIADFGERSGSNLGATLMSGVRKVGVGSALAVGALLTGALVKGWGRLTQIEDARASLQGLGHDAATIDLIMKNALASVKGTAFGLGDAATIAASTVAAGIKPGNDLRRVLGLVGDAATIAKTSIGEMGSIFNKVAASNRLSMQEVNQLSDRGIPIMQWLAKQYGVTADEARKMVERGQVDFSAFSNAFETNIAGAALKSGDTTRGAFANMGAAASRFVAGLLGGVFPKIKTGFATVIDVIDRITPAATKFGEAIGKLIEKNPGPAFAAFAVIIGGVLLGAIVAVVSLLGAGVLVFAAVTGAIAALAAGIVYAYQHSEIFRTIVQGVVGWLTGTAWPAIQGFARGVGDVFTALVGWVRQHWAEIQEAISHAVNVVRDIVTVVLNVIAALWRAWGDDLLRIAKTIWNFIQESIANALQLVRGVISLVLALINGDWGKAWDALKSIVGAVWNQIGNIISTAFGLVREIIGGVLSTIQQIWSGAWDALKSVLRGAIASIVDIFLGFVETIVNGARTAFGWIPLLKGPLNDAARAVAGFRDDVNAYIRGITPHKVVTIDFRTSGSPALNGPAVPSANAKGGTFTGWSWVGEEGPELIHSSSPTHVLSNPDSMALMGEANGRREVTFQIDTVNLNDETDMDMFFARARFAELAGSAG